MRGLGVRGVLGAGVDLLGAGVDLLVDGVGLVGFVGAVRIHDGGAVGLVGAVFTT